MNLNKMTSRIIHNRYRNFCNNLLRKIKIAFEIYEFWYMVKILKELGQLLKKSPISNNLTKKPIKSVTS